jgi:hypothetical protein
MADMLFACFDRCRLPARIGGVDAIVRGNDTHSVIDRDAAQANGFCSANHPTEVFKAKQIEYIFPQQRLRLCELLAIEPFALADGRDRVIFNLAIIKLGDDLFEMIDLIVKAQFRLIFASADASHDADMKRMAVSRSQGNTISKHGTSPANARADDLATTLWRRHPLALPRRPRIEMPGSLLVAPCNRTWNYAIFLGLQGIGRT